MTRRELVINTLEFKNKTGIVPREVWTLPWAKLNYSKEYDEILAEFPNDIIMARPTYKKPSPVTVGDMFAVGRYVDDWGCQFENKQEGIIGEVDIPIVSDDDWEDVNNVYIPREWLDFDVDAVNELCRGTDGFVLAGVYPRPFEQLQFIRGTENLMMDLVDPPEEMLKFIKKMHSFYCELMERWAQTDVDGLMFMDDWGMQNSLLINPETWIDIFKPLYKDYINIAKKHGKKTFMHSDGNILSIIPELIDIGLDAINSQVFCMGFDQLQQFKGKITFWGEIDRQNILPFGTPEQSSAAVEELMNSLWSDGGVIAQLEFGLGAKPENVRSAFTRWNEYGERSKLSSL